MYSGVYRGVLQAPQDVFLTDCCQVLSGSVCWHSLYPHHGSVWSLTFHLDAVALDVTLHVVLDVLSHSLLWLGRCNEYSCRPST
jgi:hypothetical protein